MVDKKRKIPGLASRKGGVVYKIKRNGKIQAVNSKNRMIKVLGTRCQLKLAGLPQRVQSKESKDLEKLSACGWEQRAKGLALGKQIAKDAAKAARNDLDKNFLAYKKRIGAGPQAITRANYNKDRARAGVRRMRNAIPAMKAAFEENKANDAITRKYEKERAQYMNDLKKFRDLKKKIQDARAKRNRNAGK
jgi:hypothetical protein